ncbi:SGNH/GDSL hydrolase family protein [Cryobacterium sp. TMT1-21]|uniref:SGNH/GDSL hydrolase family protein n=1 Tax=Cryobacterium shii TaxID=1259235 RepID=A0AAQ2C6H0_9MICO|nr:SGNH/GDSL hydrolase family protein [Cryobacterium shii]TFC86923.1 SGNH/GDSL hydrolase family protein [Cryobacterium sp. TmT2-59]TFD12038.1 SGNH/GDSL hydrolase family protein [Cryobacterium sp. TMT1-21]TFD14660.1 SGNH/GDSL hydrolase family protein [Cryobacterium sp. TMT4-10]TFD18562.1 SGNH/GDSL hydrolase family protein [Cryobacterium sp. TMT2-23]TFD38010.1 SGNH/GDSL hydrolase family protein [Cryobacterium sp. TMT2-10]
MTVGAVSTAAGIGVAVVANHRAFQQRVSASAVILNETLPVHSLWWRTRAKDKGELLYAVIGDSAAQGIGASSPHRGYVGILADQIALTTARTVRVVNLSVSGATVGLAVRDQLPKFVKLTPDIVTVAIGANDIALWDAVAFEAGIRTVFAALPPHALVASLPCFHLPRNERMVAVANRIIAEVAAEHRLTVVPLHATTKRLGLRSVATHVAGDLFHPNNRGYRAWADAFLPALEASLTRRFPPLEAESAPAGAATSAPAPAAAPTTATDPAEAPLTATPTGSAAETTAATTPNTSGVGGPS